MRRTTGLRRTSLLRRRVALRPMSKKREAQMPERRALVEKVLAERPVCQVRGFDGKYQIDGCTSRSEHVHEILTRARGGSILDEDNCLAVCCRHHRLIHDNPAAAEGFGLLRHSWDR